MGLVYECKYFFLGIGLCPLERTPSGAGTPGVEWSWGSYMALWVGVSLAVHDVLPLQLVVPCVWFSWVFLPTGLLEGWAPARGGSVLGDIKG